MCSVPVLAVLALERNDEGRAMGISVRKRSCVDARACPHYRVVIVMVTRVVEIAQKE